MLPTQSMNLKKVLKKVMYACMSAVKKSGGEKYFKLLALTSDSTNATVDQSKGIVTFKIGPEETKIASDTTNENGEVKLCKRK